MRIVVASICVVGAGLLIAASMAMNWTFWTGQGPDEASARVLGAVSIGVDVFKPMLPIIVAASWLQGQRLGALIATVFFAGCLAFSFFSAIGFAASSRGAVTGGREAKALRYQEVQKDLKGIKAQIEALGAVRPGPVIEAAINHARYDRRWSNSKECTDATAVTSRAFCQSMADLRGELAAVSEARNLRDRESTLQRDGDLLLAAGAKLEQDPQARLLAHLSGLGLERVQTSLTVLLALLVEFGAAFGLYLATLPLRGGPPAPPVPPADAKLTVTPPPSLSPPMRLIRGPDGQLMIE